MVDIVGGVERVGLEEEKIPGREEGGVREVDGMAENSKSEPGRAMRSERQIRQVEKHAADKQVVHRATRIVTCGEWVVDI
jgi:hypothetical protein